MAVIPTAAFQMTDASFLIGADEHVAAFSNVTIEATYPSSTWTNIGGVSSTFQGVPNWQITGTYAQDWKSENSTSVYLMENIGVEAVATFTPQDGGRPFTATITLAAGAIGGGTGSVVESTVTFLVKGAVSMGELPD